MSGIANFRFLKGDSVFGVINLGISTLVIALAIAVIIATSDQIGKIVKLSEELEKEGFESQQNHGEREKRQFEISLEQKMPG